MSFESNFKLTVCFGFANAYLCKIVKQVAWKILTNQGEDEVFSANHLYNEICISRAFRSGWTGLSKGRKDRLFSPLFCYSLTLFHGLYGVLFHKFWFVCCRHNDLQIIYFIKTRLVYPFVLNFLFVCSTFKILGYCQHPMLNDSGHWKRFSGCYRHSVTTCCWQWEGWVLMCTCFVGQTSIHGNPGHCLA